MSLKPRPQSPLTLSLAVLVLATLFLMEGGTATIAQDNPAYIKQVRVMEIDDLGIQHPAGLAFSPRANAFHIIKAREPGQPATADTELLKVTSDENLVSSASIPAAIADPINMAFDNYLGRLLILQPFANNLVAVEEGAGSELDPNTLIRHQAQHFGLQDPQGLTVDPASGDLYVLDRTGPRIVRVEPDSNGNFAGAGVSEIDLEGSGLVNLRGVAFDPTSGHLHVLSLADGGLYELDQSGQVVAVRDLSPFDLGHPQGLVFAPSGDHTDDPTQMNLFIADGAHIAEMSFIQVVAPAAPVATATLIRTIDTSLWSPPSPDPSGITYLESSGTLLISDGEVDELTIPPNAVQFTGDNLFESSLTGILTDTLTTLPITQTEFFSDEPTGVTVNPTNKHLFFSDDTGTRSIYELNPGTDGLYNTSDDIVTSFPTSAFGSSDPEGVTYATGLGASGLGVLFIVDGTNREVYQVDPGANGLFGDGDDVVTHFDTEGLGIVDPEGIVYNSDTGNLYLVGESEVDLYEVTITGNLLQTINVSDASAHKLAGLAIAPGSLSPSEMHIYIVDRGTDNGSDPLENDGKVYEFTLPPFINVPPEAVNDSDSTFEGTPVTIDVANNDSDPNGNLNPASANTTCPTCTVPANGVLTNNGDGTFDYDPNPGFSGVDNFVYEICDTGVPSLCDTATVTISVTQNNPPLAVNDSKSTLEDTLVTIDVADNDSDPNGNLDPSSANTTCVTGSPVCAGPAHGLLANNLDGTFDYTPNPGFSGGDNFVYEICDTLGLCDTATVTITVNEINDPPNAVDDVATTPTNTLVTIDVAGNDSDPNGNLNPASANKDCSTCSEPSDGVLVNNMDGTFDYTPDLNFNGDDNFIYEICDTGALCDTATVTITVVNDSPVAVDDNAMTLKNKQVTINVAANDSDPEGNLDLTSTNTDCDNGSTGCFEPVNGVLVNNMDGTFDYTPNSGFTGGDQFVYEICDTGALCDTATVTINIIIVQHTVMIPLVTSQ